MDTDIYKFVLNMNQDFKMTNSTHTWAEGHTEVIYFFQAL